MEKMDLQKQATMLIKQLSTEKLKEVVDYLADLQGKDADNILPIISSSRDSREGAWNVYP